MPHDDVRQTGNHLELFQDGKQITIAGDPIVFTEADAEALRNEFYDQTDFAEKYAWTPENLAVLTRVSAKLNRFNPMPNAISSGAGIGRGAIWWRMPRIELAATAAHSKR